MNAYSATPPHKSWLGSASVMCSALLSIATHAQDITPVLQLTHMLAQPPSHADRPHDAPPMPWANGVEQWQPNSSNCESQTVPVWEQLTLDAALARTLCQSPALRQALADVSEQMAGVELADISNNPRFNASFDYNASRNFNSSGNSGRTAGASLGLSWVLFDFGQGNANLEAARQTLAAALANQSNTLLESVRELVRLYGEAVTAHSALEATSEAETTAHQTAAAAQARYDAKVGNQIDRLQARTALAQASLERVRAGSTWENARGNLALALGTDISQPLSLADWERWTQPSSSPTPLAEIRQHIMLTHPRIRAVQAQIDGLNARLEAVRAENSGRVTVNVSGGTSRNWGAAGGGNTPTANASLLATLPLFNQRESQLQQAQVLAQLAAREAERDTVKRDLDSQLWQAHQALLTSRQSLEASEQLRLSADNTYRVAQGRYRAGVGSMLELLTAQTSLADARRQRVIAQVDQLTAQTQLSLATGRIGP